MKSKILLIVEGEKTELKILGGESHGLLSLIGAEYEIVPFANCIYELYDAYIDGEYDNIVSYLRQNKGLKIKENILSKNAFSAIYLIFDYEPHHQKYSDEKIKKMSEFFNNETEMGKLYINYPMVESYYYLESLPDNNYDSRIISLEGLSGKKYKLEVNKKTCLKKNKITKKELCYIIMQNYNKARLLDNEKSSMINYDDILINQIKMKNLNNEINVLSTFPLITIDYNIDKTLDILKLKLKNNYLEIDE